MGVGALYGGGWPLSFNLWPHSTLEQHFGHAWWYSLNPMHVTRTENNNKKRMNKNKQTWFSKHSVTVQYIHVRLAVWYLNLRYAHATLLTWLEYLTEDLWTTHNWYNMKNCRNFQLHCAHYPPSCRSHMHEVKYARCRKDVEVMKLE